MQQQKHWPATLLSRISLWEELSEYLVWSPLITNKDWDRLSEGHTGTLSPVSFWPVPCTWSVTSLPTQLIPGARFLLTSEQLSNQVVFSLHTETISPLRAGGRRECTGRLAADLRSSLHSPLAPSFSSPYKLMSAWKSQWENNSHTHFQTQTGQLSSKSPPVIKYERSLCPTPRSFCLTVDQSHDLLCSGGS